MSGLLAKNTILVMSDEWWVAYSTKNFTQISDELLVMNDELSFA